MAQEQDLPASTDEDIIKEARVRLRLASDSEANNRQEALTDINFANGDQWPVDIKRDRDTDARPCLTINITDAVVRRITNALRENRPRIKFHPVGGGADVQIAKVRNGIMRHIESSSAAEYAYDCAVEGAVRGGWGYIRVGSKYVQEDSFDQDLTIEAIRNPFTVYMDPASRMPDGSDAAWCLVSDWIRRDEYRQRFGSDAPQYSRSRAVIASALNFVGAGDDISDWSNKEEIRLAEYWRVVTRLDTLYLLSDGSPVFRTNLPHGQHMAAAGLQIARNNAGELISRKVLRKHVEWRLLTADRILDKREWPGKWIPIIPVYGREVDVNGKVKRKGVIRDLRDPARMYNYAQTSKTEVYALMPKAPWLIAEGQMEGHEAAWRDANRKPIVALPYKPVRLEDGTMAPPPQRQAPPQPNAGFAEWGDSTRSDFLAVAGMPNDPDADKKGEVVSGVAIRRRQGLSDISHFDFADNLTRSLKHVGNVVSDLIPHFYDTTRIQRIIGDDGTPDTTTINEKVIDPETQAVIKVKNDMTGGLYDTVVDTGPGYQTKREEAAEAMLELLATPLGQMTAQVAGDIVVRQMDFPEAEAIADRMAAMIPGAQIDKDSDIPPKAQMMIKGLQAQLQQANQKSMAFELELKGKHALEEMRQKGENERAELAAKVKIHDTDQWVAMEREKVHTQAITQHDVAEIHGATQLLNTHAEAAHAKEEAKTLLAAGTKAEKRD